MSKYPKIIMDTSVNAPNRMSANFTTEQLYDFMHHSHEEFKSIPDKEENEQASADLEAKLKDKVDKEDGKALIAISEIERLAKVTNYDDTEIKALFEKGLKDLYNKIIGRANDDTTIDEAFDTLVEVAKYIAEDGAAAEEMLKKIASIEAALKDKVDKEDGKALIAISEIERLAKVDNYNDKDIKEALNSKVSAEEGKALIAVKEIERLAKVFNYDDTEIRGLITKIVQYDKSTAREDLVSEHYIDKRAEPYFNEKLNCFFANGIPVRVEADPENENGVIIKWGFNGIAKIEDSTNLYIYGGGDGYVTPKYISRAKVTVNSGYVRCLYAGGLANSVVDAAEIIINGGEVKNIMCGGRASDTRDAINRSSVVYNSKCIMNGGKCDMLVGGSVGYGIVEDVEIIMNDGIVSSYFIAGGSNGAVERAKITVNGGEIKLYQSTNRGYMTDVEFNMTGGNIEKLYCGGETAQDVDGTINSFKCNITGGTIGTMHVGTDGSTAKATNVEYVEVLMSIDKISGVVADGVVTTIADELKAKLTA